MRRQPLPTLDFLLNEWLDLGPARAAAVRRLRQGGDRDVLDTAADIAAKWYEPANRIIDDCEPRFEDGRVALPKDTEAAWDAYVEFGFLLASHDAEHGGLQLPRVADFATKVISMPPRSESALGCSPRPCRLASRTATPPSETCSPSPSRRAVDGDDVPL